MTSTHYLCTIRKVALVLTLTGAGQTSLAQNSEREVVLEIEFGSSWQTRNDVQIPNDSMGSRFALDDSVGNGPCSALERTSSGTLTKNMALGSCLPHFPMKKLVYLMPT